MRPLPAWAALLVLVIIASTAFLLTNRLHVTADEGYLLESAHRLSQGELPYRDFFFLYTPMLPIVLLPAALFGTGMMAILLERITLFFIVIISGIVLYQIARHFCDPLRSQIATAIGLVFLYMKFNILTPSFLANLFAACLVLLLLKKERMPKSVFYPSVVLLSAMVVGSKHNIGAFTVGAVILSSAVRTIAGWKSIGKDGAWKEQLAIVASVMLGALLVVAALLPYKEAAYTQLIAFASKYPLIGFHLSDIGFLFVHGTIVASTIILCALAYRHKLYAKRNGIVLVYCFALAGLMQGFMYRDVIHLFDGLYLLPLAILAVKERRKKGMKSRTKSVAAMMRMAPTAFLIALTAILLIVTVRYYTPDDLHGVYFQDGMLISDSLWNTTVIAKMAGQAENPYLFVYPNDGIIWVISEKRNPSFYNQFYTGYYSSEEEQRAVIEDLERHRPAIITTKRYAENIDYTTLNEYIAKNSVVIDERGLYELREMLPETATG